MRAANKTLRVGAMVAVALALFMAGSFLIGRERRFWERKVEYEIRFQRANGLRESSAVSLSGVDIGSVEEISFPDDPDATYISVRISVAGWASPRIRGDTVARILTQGVLGDKYVELSAGLPDAPQLPPGAIIASEDPVDYEKLLGRGGDIITNIVEASNSLKNVFAAIDRGEGLLGQMLKNREDGTAVFDDMRKTVDHLESTTAAVERVVRDVQAGKGAFGALLRRGDEVDRALRSLDRTATTLASLAARLDKAQGALPRLLEDEQYGRELLADLRRAARDLAEIADKANRGQGTLGHLVNDPSLYRNANEFVSSARASWVFSVYRGVRGLFPPYAPPAPPSPTPASVTTSPATD